MKNLIVGVSIFTALLTQGCASNGIKRDFNREGEVLQVTVNQYSPSVFKYKVENHQKGMRGQAWYYLGDDHTCNISMKRMSIIKVDDDYTMTLGHELMHCLYGNYHD